MPGFRSTRIARQLARPTPRHGLSRRYDRVPAPRRDPADAVRPSRLTRSRKQACQSTRLPGVVGGERAGKGPRQRRRTLAGHSRPTQAAARKCCRWSSCAAGGGFSSRARKSWRASRTPARRSPARGLRFIFAGECAGEKQLVLAPADAAVAIDIAGLAPGRRIGLTELARITARRAPADERRRHIAQRFVRPHFVVVAAPLVDRAALFRLSHHTDSRDKRPAPVEANGGPLSERIAFGRPNS